MKFQQALWPPPPIDFAGPDEPRPGHGAPADADTQGYRVAAGQALAIAGEYLLAADAHEAGDYFQRAGCVRQAQAALHQLLLPANAPDLPPGQLRWAADDFPSAPGHEFTCSRNRWL